MRARVNHREDRIIRGASAALCLDFANTLAYRGSTPVEELQTFDELVAWCVCAGVLETEEAALRRVWGAAHQKLAATIFDEAIALREALYRIFAPAGASEADEDLKLLNHALRATPARDMIERDVGDGGGFGWRIEGRPATMTELLAPILWSAGDLLTGQLLGRVRVCANPDCLWLFLDDSKGGARRWCSMQACGNRAKARRHYLRHKVG